MKILIVDDDLFTRMTFKSAMKRYGTCDMAANGIEALQIFCDAFAKGDPYRLVLLDIQMPGMDGLEALKKIRQFEMDAEIPLEDMAIIIMVTALYTQKTVIKAYQEGGCNDYVVKSDSLQILHDKMQEYGFAVSAS